MNDHLLLAATLDAVVVERPQPTEEEPPHLCMDKGYDNAPTRQVLKEREYQEHIRRIGEEKKDETGEEGRDRRRRTRPEKKDETGEEGRDRREDASGPPLGGGAHVLMAVAVAGTADPLGQEAAELPGKHEARLCSALVPTSLPSRINTLG